MVRKHVLADNYAVTAVLKSCVLQRALGSGKEVNGLVLKSGIGVEVYRLTAELAVVEVRKRGGDAVAAAVRGVWEERLKPLLVFEMMKEYVW